MPFDPVKPEVSEKKRLAALIRAGSALVPEGKLYWGREGCCAIGTAAVALGYDGRGSCVQFMQEQRFSRQLVMEVSSDHACGKTRAELADMLDADG